jgi:hypothetical protein
VQLAPELNGEIGTGEASDFYIVALYVAVHVIETRTLGRQASHTLTPRRG